MPPPGCVVHFRLENALDTEDLVTRMQLVLVQDGHDGVLGCVFRVERHSPLLALRPSLSPSSSTIGSVGLGTLSVPGTSLSPGLYCSSSWRSSVPSITSRSTSRWATASKASRRACKML